MERCDFCSVMAIIRKYISESYDISQTDLLYELFAAFANDEQNYEYVFDNGLVCRWFKGAAKISPQITRYYTDEHNKKRLSSDIEKKILPLMVDGEMAVREIYDLVVYDTTISDGVKQKLTAGYPFSNSKEKADFLCAVLCFSMERNFIKRETGNKKLTSGKALSPIVNDVIFGADVPKPCRYFCGRDKELDALHDQLSENSKIFLQGIPGIGKSELAKAYAKKHKKDYTNIIYLKYSGSLKADIVNLDFADDYNANEPEAERFRRHNRFLRNLKDDSLIIIDNFNAIATDDELLSDVLEYSCRILFTTRSRFDDYDTYTIEEMPDDALLELMGKLFTDADKYQAILSEIIHTVHGHTFAVELAARLLEVGILAPDQLSEKLRAEKAAMDSEDKVSARKDGKSKKATYYTHIHTLFSLYKLSSDLFFQNSNPVVISDAAAIAQPIGPAKAQIASPAAIPPPPAAIAPPPNHAKAAFVAAAPLKDEIAVPVDATPNVVAIPIAAVGPIVTTVTPRPAPTAPAPACLAWATV